MEELLCVGTYNNYRFGNSPKKGTEYRKTLPFLLLIFLFIALGFKTLKDILIKLMLSMSWSSEENIFIKCCQNERSYLQKDKVGST